jgi:hypothetical protein
VDARSRGQQLSFSDDLQNFFNQKPFNPNPTQRAFILSEAKADLFSSRRGEGKSTGLSWAIFHHTLQNTGARWVCCRDTFENLTKTTQRTFFEWWPDGLFGRYHKTNKEWTWNDQIYLWGKQLKGSVLWLGMDDPADASRLLSLEIGGIAMDEPAPAVTSGGIDEMIFDLGLTSLRQPGMRYAVKLAENNPDESHWTYKKFVEEPLEGFKLWQPPVPENVANLPPNYYEDMRKSLAHRPDLQRRFIDGEFGFQSEGRACTPQWNDKLHLAIGLSPIPRIPVTMLWDWGHNPTCVVTQQTPAGQWLILDALVGDGIGVEELIENEVAPLWRERYEGGQHELSHIGDPAGLTGDQSSVARSPVMSVRARLRGPFRPGPIKVDERLEPARSVLTRTIQGQGLVRVDRHRAAPVWYALRGGWHFPVGKTGLIGSVPRKNMHSHPGDAFSYGAALLYPLGRFGRKRVSASLPPEPRYWGARGPDPLLKGLRSL